MMLVRRGAITAAVWVLGAIVLIAIAVVGVRFGGPRLWGVLDGYIDPRTPTERKDLVNILVLIGAGTVGALTALAALLNAYFSRRNLQNAREALRQQRDLDERRSQDDALQAYLEQMGDLLIAHNLSKSTSHDVVQQLAQAQTLTLLARLDKRRNGALIRFLQGAGLIERPRPIVYLFGTDLSGAVLSGDVFARADLSGTNLSNAKLGRTF
jgi:uncharacterized protein YjbI with pentapeptide repeats